MLNQSRKIIFGLMLFLTIAGPINTYAKDNNQPEESTLYKFGKYSLCCGCLYLIIVYGAAHADMNYKTNYFESVTKPLHPLFRFLYKQIKFNI